jgi:hypothetical protein
MARAATVPLVRSATLYQWLVDREERSLAAGGTLCWWPDQPSYDANPQRLAALRAGEPVDIAASDLPLYARAGMVCHWWTRAVVSADGAVTFRDDDGAAWLAENDLQADDPPVNGMPTGASLFVWLPDRRDKFARAQKRRADADNLRRLHPRAGD